MNCIWNNGKSNAMKIFVMLFIVFSVGSCSEKKDTVPQDVVIEDDLISPDQEIDQRDLEITLSNFIRKQTEFSFEISVKNNSPNVIWFHYDSARKSTTLKENTIYYSPNAVYIPFPFEASGGGLVYSWGIEKISPNEKINKRFRHKYIQGSVVVILVDDEERLVGSYQEDSSAPNFLDAEYINVTFVFLDYGISTPMDAILYSQIMKTDARLERMIHKID